MKDGSDNVVPDGPGEAGAFLGLPAPESVQVSILPVPFESSTSFGNGTRFGPDAIINASRYIELYDCETDREIYDIGIETLNPIETSDAQQMLSKVESAVKEALSDEKFVVTLGGEHTISQAPIRACAQVYDNFSVLQFDAHTDLRDQYEGSPLSHASVMARVKEIPQVSNIVAVGIRAMDSSELENVDRNDLFFDHELKDSPHWIQRVTNRLSDHVYISFDIDVFGSGTMPATGTPEPGGMEWFEALSLLKYVCEQRTVIGFDLVELMPLSGFEAPNFLAAKLVYKFLNYRFFDSCPPILGGTKGGEP